MMKIENTRNQYPPIDIDKQQVVKETVKGEGDSIGASQVATPPVAARSSPLRPLAAVQQRWPVKRRVETTCNKFHRAAVDGYVDMLCDAPKRCANLAAQDCNQLTPTLMAAQSGQLEALRILVGRGGDPERVSASGSSGLHLAAANNHLNCVSFLVNFGVNMWALDDEWHTAKDVAAMQQAQEVLAYLDQMMAKQSALNTKQVQKLKAKAKSATEKRIKMARKTQLKTIKQIERDERLLAKMSNGRRLLRAAHSISDIKLVGRCPQQQQQSTPPESVGRFSLLKNNKPEVGQATGPNSPHSPHTLTSFVSQRVQADLLARSRRSRQLLSSLGMGYSSRTSTTSSSNSCASGRTATTAHTRTTASSDLDSAYASSVSSTSGYLSSCSARSILKPTPMMNAGGNGGASKQSTGLSPAALSPVFALTKAQSTNKQQMPKYSDLVAVKQQVDSRAPNHGSIMGAATAAKMVEPATGANGRWRNLGGGVSRKVHLKRLLQSTRQTGGTSSPQTSADSAASLQEEGEHSEKPPEEVAVSSQLAASNSGVHKKSSTSWPASGGVSLLSRARSEPDFGAALRAGEQQQPPSHSELSYEDEDEDDYDHDEGANHEENENEQEEERQREERPFKGNDENPKTRQIEGLNARKVPRPPPLPPSERQTTQSSTILSSDNKAPRLPAVPAAAAPLQQQQQNNHYQLLDQCLSQLRKQHEAMISGKHQVKFAGSDELLRHQLNASEFPLRPSVIKQQQQQQAGQPNQPNHRLPVPRTLAAEPVRLENVSADDEPPVRPVTADSIGSAGSLIQRDSPQDCENGNHHNHLHHHLSGSNERSQADGIGGREQVAAADGQLERFLVASGLAQLTPILLRESIDFEALLLLSEDDLKSLQILLGPRRKLLNALERHRRAAAAASRIDGISQPLPPPALIMADTQF